MTFGMFATTANFVYDKETINIVYQSDGLLNLIRAISSTESDETLALLDSILRQYEGMRIGMAFGK